MTRTLFSLLLLAASMTGCQKHEPVPVAAAPPEPAAAAATSTASGEPDLGQLTVSLRKWCMTHKRTPKNFEDFSATANPPLPPAPPGKQFALGPGTTVILVKR